MGLFDWLSGLFGGYDPLKDYDFEDVVTLTGRNGEETDYYYIEGCKLSNKYYAVLELRGETEDDYEFSVWEITHESDGNYFQRVNDSRLEKKVIEICSKKFGD